MDQNKNMPSQHQPLNKQKDKSSRGTTKTSKKQLQQFLGLINQQKQQQISTRIKNYYGKNFPIAYRPQYKFVQQWQSKQSGQGQNDGNLLEQLGLSYILFCILTMVVSVISIWILSVQRYFNTKQLSTSAPIYYILIVLNVIDIIIKWYLKYSEIQHYPDISFIFSNFYRHFIVISFFLFDIFICSNQSFMYPLQIFIIYFLYKKAAQIYGYIKVMEFGLQYQNHVKIFDLLFNIFIQAHTFAILLFSSSKIDPTNNWVTVAGLDSQTYIVKYVNAIYFACTTMLTIGYGDIAPHSVGQKLVTIVVEIVGVIAFGYLLNQMGHTLSKMRQQSQIMERDLQTISKISKYYNLQSKLQNKARNFIFNNQRENESLKIQDQNRLLMKLNEDLRQEINLENSLNVVKSCIFYLCHWSKDMQSLIAQKLQKRMFAPNEKIVSTDGQDRIYIIKKGKVDIYMNRYGINQEHKKLLKMIDMESPGRLEVSDNIYGYTTVFSNRPVKLQAIAKDFTSTYSVNKDQFLFCINQNIMDFEYYHQIRSRIDQSSFCQQWQAPAIRNSREHYEPSRIVLIKKYHKRPTIHSRKLHKRNSKSKFKLIQGMFNKTRMQIQDLNNLAERTIQFTARYLPQPIASGQIALDQIQSDNDNSSESIRSIDSQQKSHQLAIQKMKTFAKDVQQKQNLKSISAKFQASKEYYNFFRLNNISRVLLHLEKLNFMESRLGDPNTMSKFSVSVQI